MPEDQNVSYAVTASAPGAGSPSAAFFKAFAKMQGELPEVEKTKQSSMFGKQKYMYADLTDVVKAIRPILSKHGFSIIQCVQDDSFVTIVGHESGVIQASVKMPPYKSNQDLGTILTYYRRYFLCSMLGIVADDDLDGEQASSISTGNSGRQSQQTGERRVEPPKSQVSPRVETPTQVGVDYDAMLTFGKFKGKKCSAWGKTQLEQYLRDLCGHPNFNLATQSKEALAMIQSIELYLSHVNVEARGDGTVGSADPRGNPPVPTSPTDTGMVK